MNGLVIILTVLITAVLAFWFFDKFHISDRFITILSVVFGMVSMLSLAKEKEKIMKTAIIAIMVALLGFVAVLFFKELTKPDFQSPFISEPHITQRFKPDHYGLDLALPVGATLHPIREGTVIRALPCPNCDSIQDSIPDCGVQEGVYRDPRWNYGYGRAVVIRHDSPFSGGSAYLYSLYAHLDRTNVDRGDKVNLQTIIGFSGNSGCSTGSHLHLELRSGNVLDTKGVWLKQTALDPAKILGW